MAEAIVTLPDGRKARVTGPSREAIQAKIGQLTQQEPPQEQAGGFGTALTGGMAERLIDNTLGIPEAVARAGQGAVNVGRGMLGQDMIRRQPGESLLGLPSGREVLSGAQAAPGLLGGNFGEQFQGAQQQRQQIAEQNPGATATGGFLGDAATLATGRAPLIRGTAPAQATAARGAINPATAGKGPVSGGLFDRPIQSGIERAASAAGNTPSQVGARRAVERVLKTEGFQNLARAAGRSAETGLEGAMLSMLQDGDPVETAAFAAGGQLAASGALGLAQESVELPFKLLGSTKPKGLKGQLAGAVVSASLATGLFQILKSVTPGGQNRILESEEAGFKKIAFSLLLGATAGVAGKRTKPDGILAQFPALADSVLTVPRTGLLKLAQAATEDPVIESTVTRISSNPGAFTQDQLKRFGESVESENPADSIRQMLENDESFRERIEAPHPKLAGVPVREEE